MSDSRNQFIGDNLMKIWKNPVSITVQKWVELLKNPKITYDLNKKILKALYESDNHANICSEIVKMINDPNCRAHGAVNSSIGKFGKRILKETGVQAPSFRDDGIPWGWNVPFLGWHDDKHRGHYFWKLRPELEKAIRSHPDILQPSEKSLPREGKTNVWIFQSNPKDYDLFKDLPELTNVNPDGWPIRQYKHKIKAGDLALLWVSDTAGKKRGIHAIARIFSIDEHSPYEKSNLNPWAKHNDWWAKFEYLKAIDPPLLVSFLKEIGLSNLSIIRRPNGTNFPVTESEWMILSKEIEKREVIISPLKLKSATSYSATNQGFIDQKDVARHNQNKKLSLDELKKRARHSQKDVKKRENNSSIFERNQDVVDYVKIVAKGICQLCEAPAPFRDKDGDPFLHAHHIIWLRRKGPDTIDNCVALCPNCHARMHALDEKDDFTKLIEIARRHSE